jgi:hypothetical protein
MPAIQYKVNLNGDEKFELETLVINVKVQLVVKPELAFY